MGSILNSSSLGLDIIMNSNRPIILCTVNAKIQRVIVDNYSTVSLNAKLAQELMQYEPAARCQKAYNVAVEILKLAHGHIYLTDFEMLFDPRYNIDVLKFICEINRYKKVIARWCGEFANGKLTYSSPEYVDYHSYTVESHDIICIV